MRILLWHGYLLSGSGSNLYTQNVARVWRDEGHDVLILCQEREAARFSFVDEQGDFTGDNGSFRTMPTRHVASSGRCRLVRPAIGEVLPVYVYDEYEGFAAKRFVDLTDEELAHYTATNVDALATAIAEHRPHAVITGHEVMGPFIAREACRRTEHTYVAKLHGSALEYAVKEQTRYRDYAHAGLNGARVVVGGSRYMVAEASAIVPGWEDRAVVVNPGCDIELFRPQSQAGDRRPVLGYVGKLIPSKGVHHLLAALGLTSVPGMRVVMVGYGGFETPLLRLWDALHRGDAAGAQAIARADDVALEPLRAFIDAHREDDGYFARTAEIELDFKGRLDHEELAALLPGFDVLVVPSVLAEAFGMVAAEAAACGVLPIVPGHSGIGEVGAALEEALGRPGLLTFDPVRPIEDLAATIDRLFAVPAPKRRAMGAVAASLARTRWSWERVAGRLLAVAAR